MLSENSLEVIENYKRYRQRVELFKKFDYDISYERDVVFEQACPVDGSILEVGTGKGHFAIILAQKGCHFTSVDVSEEEQEFAKLNMEHLNLMEYADFQIADGECLKFQDSSFDIIFSINVLHHLLNPYRVVDEMVRVLKKDGKIIISDFSIKGMELVAKIHKSEGREHSAGKVVVNDISDYLAKKKFKIKKHTTVFQETLIAY